MDLSGLMHDSYFLWVCCLVLLHVGSSHGLREGPPYSQHTEQSEEQQWRLVENVGQVVVSSEHISENRDSNAFYSDDFQFHAAEGENFKERHENREVKSPPSFHPSNQQFLGSTNDRRTGTKETQDQPNIPATPCHGIPDPGPCDAIHKRYYFSKDTRECHPFVYGGCDGNSNNFLTLSKCNLACLSHN